MNDWQNELKRRFCIEFPASIKEVLIEANDELITAMKDNMDWDYNSGYLPPLTNLTKYQKVSYETFEWIEDTNLILENIELIISDLELYLDTERCNLIFFPGNKGKRYYLLIRTFFYEFFRIKEAFGLYLSKLKKHKLIDKKEIDSIKNDFHKAFEHTFEFRNKMVHSRFVWGGEENTILMQTIIADSLGLTLAKKNSNELIRQEEILAKIVSGFMPILISEIEFMIHVIGNMAESVSIEILKLKS